MDARRARHPHGVRDARPVPPPPAGTGGGARPLRARPGAVAADPRAGAELILELDPDARFHDGRALSSLDVQFTLDAIRDPGKRVEPRGPRWRR
ncbi:MAG: hypothetical protein HS111_16855 [Kofleriaceae bacterium]|nr:hypothetical protein [Kofleriaceae bacterium]